ncbi:anthranilate phosphoribosyltransferase [Helicobacter cetorum]|uniref:Anthranilate phosphoribosyltransferase n=1 Tax=Helicobacter cetorum (strain ATCC BAA-540 / CCUG 52418 / MIT 99-5656) TaxID=1163745 RepID=I0EQC3_HELCM|nr:anthranilate phosphoribosyltransferase [Helicobacter cetorum]AFI05142.1 anthranilate phosphoribosyltransferase [Helicobacter cetorum MIT 99-5656]
MKDILNTLYNQKNLSDKETERLFTLIINEEVSSVQLGAILCALKIKGESFDEISIAAQTILKHTPKPFNSNLDLIDNCGTGGDRLKTINISTIAALIASSMGLPMAKHGSRSVSSYSGSADLLENLGVNIEMNSTQLKNCLEHSQFGFLFAPLYHQSFRKSAPLRKELFAKTIFNCLGPLINPLRPKIQLLGVYDKSLCKTMALALKKIGVQRAMVVNGGGSDEIVLHDKTSVCELKNNEILEYSLSAKDFSLPPYDLKELQINDAQESTKACLDILQNKAKDSHKMVVVANVACLLYLKGIAKDLKEGVAMVLEHLKTGIAYTHLQKIIELSHV